MLTDSIRAVNDPTKVFHVSLEFTLPESDDEECGASCNVWVGSTVVANIQVFHEPFSPGRSLASIRGPRSGLIVVPLTESEAP